MKTSMPARTATPTTRSCASPRPIAAGGFSGEQLMINYNSALKVVNLGEPEASLILRKPRSPQGQGGADPSSPTGLTHVGGPRWESTEHPGLSSDPRLDPRSLGLGRAPGRSREALGRQLRARLRAGPGRRRRPQHDLAHRVRRRDARISARAGRRPGSPRDVSRGSSTSPARTAPTAASRTSRSASPTTARPGASRSQAGDGTTIRRSSMSPSPGRWPATSSFAA